MSTTSSITAAFLEHKAGFYERLIELGYSASAAKKQRQLLAEMAAWAGRHQIPLEDLPSANTEDFFRRRRARGKRNLCTPRSLDPLLAYLRHIGVVGAPACSEPKSPLEVFLARYHTFLTSERGLASGTARMYVRVASELALEAAVGGEVDWTSLRAGDVTEFAMRACGGNGVSWARQVVSALRSLLRYLQLEGLTELALDQAVLSVAGVSPPPPQGISLAEVEALLASCDRQSAMGRRDYAILVLLCRLGLRGGEVVGLTLDDIDWRAGVVVVIGKGGRRDRLPLLADVGEALADYLRHGRPPTEDRAIFLRCCAPIRGLKATGSIRSILAGACARAGIAYVRPHRLRHTLASEMLRGGVTLRDIGQVLGHQSAAATAVYAKVDFEGMRVVARQWPEVAA
jgi:site-specific recombinase XerD